jgi:hypothetical protein
LSSAALTATSAALSSVAGKSRKLPVQTRRWMNSVGARYQRLKGLVSRERRQGAPLSRSLLLGVPLRVLSKCHEKLVAWANNTVMNRASNAPRFREFQRSHADRLHNHFYVIVMPRTLHFLLPCLRLIPPAVSVVLILNGTEAWEDDCLRAHCGSYPTFKLRTFPRSSLSHGSVLNLLLDHNDSDFGILDHDLYILDPEVFGDLTFRDGEFVIGAFRLTNPRARITFPTTHFLFFNTRLIKQVQAKHGVGAQVYSRIPRRLRPALATLNLGYHNFLKDYLHYFDTLNLLFALALYEGLTVRFLDVPADDLYHIGGSSRMGGTPYEAYIHRRFLDLARRCADTQSFSHSCGSGPGAGELLDRPSMNAPHVERALERSDLAISRIEARLTSVRRAGG